MFSNLCRSTANIQRRKFTSGTVKWFNASKGFGFIASSDGKEYFAHGSGFAPSTSQNNITEGVRVMFDPSVDHNGRNRAVNILVDEPHGSVLWFSEEKGFGFISASDGSQYFAHQSDFACEKITAGMKVTFRVETGEDGRVRARDINVKEPMKGVVSHFDAEKGFGFITDPAGKSSGIFVHGSEIVDPSMEISVNNEKVEFGEMNEEISRISSLVMTAHAEKGDFKWFTMKNGGSGFTVRRGARTEVFVHHSTIRHEKAKLSEGDHVMYDIHSMDGKLRATNVVKLPDGEKENTVITGEEESEGFADEYATDEELSSEEVGVSDEVSEETSSNEAVTADKAESESAATEEAVEEADENVEETVPAEEAESESVAGEETGEKVEVKRTEESVTA